MRVIDGSTNTKIRVPIAGNSGRHYIVVNTLTNKTYVGSELETKTVTLIDGLTNQTTAIATAGYLSGIAINPVSNKIYVLNPYDGKLSVIDGSSNQVTTIAIGQKPTSIAVNSVTNKIYVANSGLWRRCHSNRRCDRPRDQNLGRNLPAESCRESDNEQDICLRSGDRDRYRPCDE